jgi:hypothetical protein
VGAPPGGAGEWRLAPPRIEPVRGAHPDHPGPAPPAGEWALPLPARPGAVSVSPTPLGSGCAGSRAGSAAIPRNAGELHAGRDGAGRDREVPLRVALPVRLRPPRRQRRRPVRLQRRRRRAARAGLGVLAPPRARRQLRGPRRHGLERASSRARAAPLAHWLPSASSSGQRARYETGVSSGPVHSSPSTGFGAGGGGTGQTAVAVRMRRRRSWCRSSGGGRRRLWPRTCWRRSRRGYGRTYRGRGE